MIVVSDTTPLSYLILTGSVHVLPAIFGRVYAPSAVIKELSHSKSPEAVRAWASSPPVWLAVQDPAHTEPQPKLGVGETVVISLALELEADRVLIDDRDGSREAKPSGLTVVGTLGVLEEAAKRGLIGIELTRD
jgi:predicted nucleic acid-binding protein